MPQLKPLATWTESDWIGAIGALMLCAFLAAGALVASSKKPEFAGHPRGLYVLFFAEMWERFSFYGMRALLILYLTKHWLFSDGKSNLIYGAYTALVYITPVLGGYLADRYLGQRKAVLFGGILLAIGHSFMAVEGSHGVLDPAIKQADPAINVFWLALAFIIVGSGFLKANISVIVGQLYSITDTRRDGAYTIFYMGINVGAALGTILVGYLGETIGWSWGFGLAGIGMLAGLLVFVAFKPLLLGQGEAPEPARLTQRVAGMKLEHLLYLIGVASVAVIWALIQYQDVMQTLLALSGILLLGYVLVSALFVLPYGSVARAPAGRVYAIYGALALMLVAMLSMTLGWQGGATPLVGGLALDATAGLAGVALALAVTVAETRAVRSHPRDRMLVILFLIALNPVFWGLFEQAGGSLSLYTDRFVDRGDVPASLFQSINPIYIVLLGPIFAALWVILGKRGIEPSAPAKFGLALLLVGVAFLVFVWGAESVGPAAMTPVLFVFAIYFFQTCGELCLSPVGLSAMNRLAPRHLASLIMGAWFYMTAVGNFVAGKIGEATGGESGEMTKEATLGVYATIGWWTVAIGLGVLLLSVFVKKLMHLDTLGRDEAGHALAGEPQLAEPAAPGTRTEGERR